MYPLTIFRQEENLYNVMVF